MVELQPEPLPMLVQIPLRCDEFMLTTLRDEADDVEAYARIRGCEKSGITMNGSDIPCTGGGRSYIRWTKRGLSP